MGIDAEILVKIKGRENWLQQEDELRTAVALASTIGAKHFFIQIDEKTGKLGSLFGDTPHHALSIIPPLRSAGECEGLGVDPTLIGAVVFTQDGDPIIAEKDEQFLRIYLWSRYYGPDYARGNWPVIRATIEWLQFHLKHGEVWYGGDSGGALMELMTQERLKEINEFYLKSGNSTYQRYFNRASRSAIPSCPACKIETINFGGGGAKEFFFCDGCGQHFIKTPQRLHIIGDKDFFKASSEIDSGALQ